MHTPFFLNGKEASWDEDALRGDYDATSWDEYAPTRDDYDSLDEYAPTRDDYDSLDEYAPY